MRSKKVREIQLWRWLKLGSCRSFKESLHLSRIENAIGPGMADVEGCLKGRQFWIELKCESRPARPETKIKPRFQSTQGPWHRRRRGSGGRSFVLLQVGAESAAKRYLLWGELIPEIEKGMTEALLEELSVIPPLASAAEVIGIASVSFHKMGDET